MQSGEFVKTAAFDSAAQSYDIDFSFSEIGKMQRESVREFLVKKGQLSKKNSILEINCGTGEDALWLAQQGCKVLATDASSKMIDVCKSKTNAKAEVQNLQFKTAKFNELKEVTQTQKFDLIFSNFGGLNCVSAREFESLIVDFFTLLNPKGKLVFVIMGRKCLWERVYFLVKGNFKRAFRRMSVDAVAANVGNGVMQDTYYFSPSEVRKIAGNNFQQEVTKPIGFWVPPSYLEKFFSNKKGVLTFFKRMDRICSKFSFLSNSADHYLIAFKKKNLSEV